MPVYNTTLVRSYSVSINADDEEVAARLVELFIGDEDLSNFSDREKYNFEIKKIEMLENDVIEIVLINEAD
jgi:hypothetical protein